jgi:hypothetical protein
MDKLKIIIIAALSLLMPSLMAHLILFSLNGYITSSFDVESILIQVATFFCCLMFLQFLLVFLIKITFRLGGAMMLITKMGLFIGLISVLVRVFIN